MGGGGGSGGGEAFSVFFSGDSSGIVEGEETVFSGFSEGFRDFLPAYF